MRQTDSMKEVISMRQKELSTTNEDTTLWTSFIPRVTRSQSQLNSTHKKQQGATQTCKDKPKDSYSNIYLNLFLNLATSRIKNQALELQWRNQLARGTCKNQASI